MYKDQSCPICLDPLKNSNVEIMPCLHVFHSSCISEWREKSDNCPLCRADFKDILEEEKKIFNCEKDVYQEPYRIPIPIPLHALVEEEKNNFREPIMINMPKYRGQRDSNGRTVRYNHRRTIGSMLR